MVRKISFAAGIVGIFSVALLTHSASAALLRLNEESGATPPSIQIVSPTPADPWGIGTVKRIKWISQNMPSNATISIILRPLITPSPFDGSYPYSDRVLFDRLANTGSQDWTVSPDIKPNPYILVINATYGPGEGDGTYDRKLVSIVNDERDHLPVIESISGPNQIIGGQNGTWTVQAHDPDNDQLTYYLCNTGACFSSNNGVLNFGWANNSGITFKESASFVVVDSKGGGAMVTKNIFIIPASSVSTNQQTNNVVSLTQLQEIIAQLTAQLQSLMQQVAALQTQVNTQQHVSVQQSVPPGQSLPAIYSYAEQTRQSNTNTVGVLKTLLAPKGDIWGLAWDGSAFWVATPYGEIDRVDQNGTTLSSIRAQLRLGNTASFNGNVFPGLAWDGSNLWISKGNHIAKLDSAGNEISGFDLPTKEWATGLAWDGTSLWFLDRGAQTINRMGNSGAVTFSAPVAGGWQLLDGLEYFNQNLYAVDAQSNTLIKMDANGNVLATMRLPGTTSVDLASDGSSLWVADVDDNVFRKIDINNLQIQPPPPPTQTPSIQVLSPNGGERLTRGQQYLVTWRNPTGARVLNVELLIGNVVVQGIVGISVSIDIAPPTSYTWTVNPRAGDGAILPDGNDYKIRVRTPDGYFADQSDAPFTIVSSQGNNLPPVVSGVSGPSNLQVGQQGTWSVTASDPEGGPLSYSVLWGDEGQYGRVAPGANVAQQTATFTHVYNATGTFTPTFTVTDNGGLTAQTSLSVQVGQTAAAPTLQVGIDPSTPPAQQLTMGSTDNALATFRFTAGSSEDVRIIGMNIFQQVFSPGVKSGFFSLKLYQGSTLVGTAGSANTSVAQGLPGPGYYYSFQFINPMIIPKDGSVPLTLKGDIASYNSSGTTDVSTHIFKITISPDPANDTPQKTVVAIGNSRYTPANVTLNNAVGNPITILRSKATVATAQLGSTSGRAKTAVDDLATLTVFADPAGPVSLNNLRITFGGTAAANGAFLDGVKLLDQNSTDVTFTAGTTATISAPCSGSSTCSKTWIFGSGTIGWPISAGSGYTFKLRFDSTKTAPAQANIVQTLKAIIVAVPDLVYADGLDSSALTVTLPDRALPVPIAAVSYAAGTASVSAGRPTTNGCGDLANNDGLITQDDIVALQNYVFLGSPIPGDKTRADVNGDGLPTPSDVVILTNYLYVNGPDLKCPAPIVPPLKPKLDANIYGTFNSQLNSISDQLQQLINQMR